MILAHDVQVAKVDYARERNTLRGSTVKFRTVTVSLSLAAFASFANAQLGSAPLPQPSASPQLPKLEAIQAWVSGKFIEAGAYPYPIRPTEWVMTRVSFEGCKMNVVTVHGNLAGPPFRADRVFRSVVLLTDIDYDEYTTKYSMFSTVGERKSIWNQGDNRASLRTADSLAAIQANTDKYVAAAESTLPVGKYIPNISSNAVWAKDEEYLMLPFPSEEIRLRVTAALRDAAKQCTTLGSLPPPSTKKPGELY